MSFEFTEIIGTKAFWVIFFLIIYFIYLYYRVKAIKQKKANEYELLVVLSRILDKSEYNIFEESGIKWDISNGRLDRDFRSYLERGTIPFYVRDFIRSHKSLFSSESDEYKPEPHKFSSP